MTPCATNAYCVVCVHKRDFSAQNPENCRCRHRRVVNKYLHDIFIYFYRCHYRFSLSPSLCFCVSPYHYIFQSVSFSDPHSHPYSSSLSHSLYQCFSIFFFCYHVFFCPRVRVCVSLARLLMGDVIRQNYPGIYTVSKTAARKKKRNGKRKKEYVFLVLLLLCLSNMYSCKFRPTRWNVLT